MIPIPSISSISDDLSGPLEGIDRESDSPVLVDQPIPHEFAQGWPPRSVDQNVEPPMEDHVVSPTEGSRLIQDLSEPEYEEPDWDYRYPGGFTSLAPTVPTRSSPDTKHRSHTVPPAPSPSSKGADGVKVVSSPSPEVVPSVPHMAPHGRPIAFYQASSRSDSPDMPIIPPRMSDNATIQVPRRSHFSAISDSPSRSSSSPEIVPPRPGSIARTIGQGSHLQHPVHRPISSTSESLYPGRQGIVIPIEAPDSPQLTYSIGQPIPAWIPIPHAIHRPPSASSSESEAIPPRFVCGTGFGPYVPGRPRDDELWFEDGNIALQTSNIEFRVYKGPLLALSPVLQAMFEDTPTSSYPGSVRFTSLDLLDTSPEDLRHVLRFVYGGTSRVEPSFSEISAHIRFGCKYKAEKLLQRSIDYLKKFYVTDLDAWLKLPSLDPPFFGPYQAIGVVNLARLLGKDGEALLPMALMRCCTLGAEIVDGFIRGDGTKETLSSGDLGRCFEGKVKLLEAIVRAAETLRADMTSDECSRPRRCKDVLARFVDELLGSEDSTGGNGAGSLANELRCLRWDLSFSLSSRRAYLQEADPDVEADEERELCPKCFARQLEEQRKIFAKLPKLMGVSVEGWATTYSAAA